MRLPHISPFKTSPLYFFTACVDDRQAALANRFAFDLLTGIWTRSAEHDGWFVGKYLLMPDHVHFFAMPARAALSRGQWHKMWKSVSSRKLALRAESPGAAWQSDTFDHVLRSAESYAAKWNYVRQNPVRAGLCLQPDDWPWQDEIHPLRY